jgi:hypothetical protein
MILVNKFEFGRFKNSWLGLVVGIVLGLVAGMLVFGLPDEAGGAEIQAVVSDKTQAKESAPCGSDYNCHSASGHRRAFKDGRYGRVRAKRRVDYPPVAMRKIKSSAQASWRRDNTARTAGTFDWHATRSKLVRNDTCISNGFFSDKMACIDGIRRIERTGTWKKHETRVLYCAGGSLAVGLLTRTGLLGMGAGAAFCYWSFYVD